MATGPPTASRTCKYSPSPLNVHRRRYTSEGKAVYMVAAMGVVMDTSNCSQKIYAGMKSEMGPKHSDAD